MAKKALSPGPRGQAGARGGGERIDWPATLAVGRPRELDQVQWRQRLAPPPALWLIIVDSSASTRRQGALSAAKGLLQTVFDQAYRQRANLAVMTAAGRAPQWARQGLKASFALQPWLAQLGAGGGSPLVEALASARAWLARRRRQRPHERQHCLVLTDGRLHFDRVAPLGCDTALVDLERTSIRLGRAQQLARLLDATCWHIDQL
ncbi:magnesium chelatase subunit ChlD-like protein [Pseudomonas sp. URIL14HWK12:I9]|nr:magnesium chelatase subunit ChlD-like protein [Pseudomonas sp. URIL14HWK12:I12]PVZ27095.1 magnesium chelatase subunit ChlD-like protein [Pseudomonas sp. URIL14HWK12:I10]PVZ37984.1 magnesium chelatase subunit ChlD-like protein [Pseudomonas sp. URIL14HWK12:I11]SNZ04905.1 magnesium chelatase subunit ChlD-like protein [Pseudomonas sp. URIL14HWK12:I9]